MTLTQILLINIVLLASGIAAHTLKEAVSSRRGPLTDIDPGYCKVGTFGSLSNFSGDMTRTPGKQLPFKPALLVLLLGIGGAAFAAVWHEANPDIRAPYGRAYERCVAKDQISRWRVEEVRRCVNSMRAE
jgi:hypothetical protein